MIPGFPPGCPPGLGLCGGLPLVGVSSLSASYRFRSGALVDGGGLPSAFATALGSPGGSGVIGARPAPAASQGPGHPVMRHHQECGLCRAFTDVLLVQSTFLMVINMITITSAGWGATPSIPANLAPILRQHGLSPPACSVSASNGAADVMAEGARVVSLTPCLPTRRPSCQRLRRACGPCNLGSI